MLPTIDFSGMTVNPNKLSDFSAYKQIFGNLPESKAKYIILMYDSKSPLKTYYSNLDARKIAAAELSSVPKNEYKELFHMKQPSVVDAVMKFLQHQNSHLWILIVSNEEAFSEYSENVMSRVDSSEDTTDKDILAAVEKKTKLLNAMHDIRSRLESYYREFYGDDEVVRTEIKARRSTPESQADVR